MAQVSGVSTYWNSPQYEGLLWTADAIEGRGNGLPFLGILGGLANGNYRIVDDFDYSMSAEFDFAVPSQPDIDETDALTAIAATSPVLSQAINSVGIVQESVNISYKKMSTMARIATQVVTGGVGYWAKEGTPVENAIKARKLYILRKIARDYNYTCMCGTYQRSTDTTTSGKTRGVVTAVSTSATAAGSVELSELLMQTLFSDCAENSNNQTFQNMPILFVPAIQKDNLSKIYGNQPESWNIGGVDIQLINTSFGRVGVVYEPMVQIDTASTDTIALLAMDAIRPVFCPVVNESGDNGLMLYEDLSKVGAGYQGMYNAQMGIDYANEKMHGKITGLTQTRI
jgi:hypothetical protein